MMNFNAPEFYKVVGQMQKLFGVNYFTGEVKLMEITDDAYVFVNEHGFKYIMTK